MTNSTKFMTIVLSAYLDIGNIKYFYFIILIIIYLATIFTNSLLIGVICVERTLHEPMYLVVCSLSVADLYGSTALFPALLLNIVSYTHEVSLSFCYTQIFVLYSYCLLEFYTLTLMSYERYISICYPLQYNSIMSTNRVSLLISIVWLFCLFNFSTALSLTLQLELCGNVIDKVYCDNYLIVKLACSDTAVNNMHGILKTVIVISVPLSIIFYSYGKILAICIKSAKETRQKAIKTCSPHIMSLLNFSLGCFFEILQSRFSKIQMPAMLRIFISVYFLICPPLLNPIMYGLRLSKLRKVCVKLLITAKQTL